MIQRNGRGGDDNSRRQQIESAINKRREVEGRGGYREMTQRGTRNAHNNHIDHAERGVVGDDDEDDDDDTTTTATTTMTTTTTTSTTIK